jgi:hypothetical protein
MCIWLLGWLSTKIQHYVLRIAKQLKLVAATGTGLAAHHSGSGLGTLTATPNKATESRTFFRDLCS